MGYTTSVRFWIFFVFIIWSVTTSEMCHPFLPFQRADRYDEDFFDVSLTFNLNDPCIRGKGTLDVIKVGLMKDHTPVIICQILQPETSCFASINCECDVDAKRYTVTRKVKVGERETWRLFGKFETGQNVETIVDIDTLRYVEQERIQSTSNELDTTSNPESNTSPVSTVATPSIESTPGTTSTPGTAATSVATVDLKPTQREAVVVEEADKKNEASSSPTPDLFNFILIGAIGGIFVIIIALFAVLFAVLFRKRERSRSRRWRDDIPAAPPVPCQFRRRHPVQEPTVVFTQRPLPDPLSPPPPPALPLTLHRQRSSDYTPLGETEHFYFRIPERKSDSSTRSCKTASSLTSVEDTSGGYMIPPEPRSRNEEAEGAAASADVTTTVTESSDYLHPV